jgi:lysozyme
VPSLVEQLILHEGLKTRVYRCPAGKWTIGVGRNLEDKGISKEEALHLLHNDVKEVDRSLRDRYEWFDELDFVRQKVCVDMAFNLGIGGFSQFKNMIRAIEQKDYVKASEEMKDSAWYRQGGVRGKRLVEMMRTGEDYKEVI